MSQDSDEMLREKLLAKRDTIEDSSTDIRDIGVLGIQYTVDNSMIIREVTLTLTAGGPTIKLDCLRGRLHGSWGSETTAIPVDAEYTQPYGDELRRRFKERIDS